jgi:hypothetical protein
VRAVTERNCPGQVMSAFPGRRFLATPLPAPQKPGHKSV